MIKISNNDLQSCFIGNIPIKKIYKGTDLVYESVNWYGIRWRDGNPTCERIGNLDYHVSLPIQNKMRRCMINSITGDIKYINDDNPFVYDDGTSVDYGNIDYQWCVEIPDYNFEAFDEDIDGVIWHTLKCYPFSKNVGIYSPKAYLGVTEMMVNSSNNSSATCLSQSFIDFVETGIDINTTSVNAHDIKYINGAETYRNYNYSNTDPTSVKCSYGRARTNVSRESFRNIAKRTSVNKFNVSQQSWQIYNSVLRLYLLEYANCNSQTNFNPVLTTEGYHQGGLGAGVTTIDNKSFNGYNPYVPCGITVGLCNKTGFINYVFAAGEFSSGVVSVQANSYRGIELPFGHIWNFIDGINRRGIGNNIEEIYVCDDVTKFTESNQTTPQPEGYSLISSTVATANTYNWKPEWDNKGTFFPKPASNNTFNDYFWNAYSIGTWYTFLGGGGADSSSGGKAGFFFLGCGGGVGSASADIGSRLQLTLNNND